MNYTIGFDLGTHQTKICVQDNTNPAEKTYDFFRFSLPDGSETILLPSIVQINKDHTLCYGYCNENTCLSYSGKNEPKPTLHLLQLPTFKEPSFVEPQNLPPKPKYDPWLDKLREINGEKTELDKWEDQCKNIIEKARRRWRKQCEKQWDLYLNKKSRIQNQNIKLQRDYDRKLSAWEKSSVEQKMIFRYFELHALTNVGKWQINRFSSQEITIWYIAYILLLLKEKYGEDFIVQFGIPCGASGTDSDKLITYKTYQLYIAAADLITKFKDVSQYLNTPYEHLRILTYINKNLNNHTINQYYFDDIPEAFASLVAVTLQKKLGDGFHLLVDIGGGTTDLALFFVRKEDYSPNILGSSDISSDTAVVKGVQA